ncbi:MAG: PKD domain-containing protein [Candidatus Diapherotrites archaeon]|nr:PKD domain-containing protein [Candidatus Diapherotrites archaeon]
MNYKFFSAILIFVFLLSGCTQPERISKEDFEKQQSDLKNSEILVPEINSVDQNAHDYNPLDINAPEKEPENEGLIFPPLREKKEFEAKIKASKIFGSVPLTVDFSFEAEGEPPYRINWAFGFKDSSDKEKPSFTFSKAGVYKVYLTLIDSTGLKGEDVLDINVTAFS